MLSLRCSDLDPLHPHTHFIDRRKTDETKTFFSFLFYFLFGIVLEHVNIIKICLNHYRVSRKGTEPKLPTADNDNFELANFFAAACKKEKKYKFSLSDGTIEIVVNLELAYIKKDTIILEHKVITDRFINS